MMIECTQEMVMYNHLELQVILPQSHFHHMQSGKTAEYSFVLLPVQKLQKLLKEQETKLHILKRLLHVRNDTFYSYLPDIHFDVSDRNCSFCVVCIQN